MDTLFAIFCQCAELNPEPNDGKYYFFFYLFLHFSVFFYMSYALLSDEGEEEHDWVFSADQMVDEEAGMCACLNLYSYYIIHAYCVILKYIIVFFLPEDEGYISHNPVNSIGQSNGNHDLGRSILEVVFFSIYLCLCSLIPTHGYSPSKGRRLK